jgi:ubiquitin carboxyl-terminal hydrolase 4/11/15
MTSDDGRLPSYSQRGTHSPPTSFNRSGDNTTLHLNVDSSDEELQTNKRFTTQNFVTSGMPYGETQWGVSSSQAGPARFSFGTDLNSSLPSPPASDDGMNYDNLRAATQAQFRGPVAEHPATEALAVADATDTVSEVDSLEVMMGKKSGEKAESGLGEEYGVIAAEKEDEGMQVDGTEVDAGKDSSAGGEKKE